MSENYQHQPDIKPRPQTALHVVSSLLNGIVFEVNPYFINCYIQNSNPIKIWDMSPYFQLSLIRSTTGLIDYLADELAVAAKSELPNRNGNFSKRLNSSLNMLQLGNAKTKTIKDKAQAMVPLRNWASHPRSNVLDVKQNGSKTIFQNFHSESLTYAQIYAYVEQMFSLAEELRDIWPEKDSTWSNLDCCKGKFQEFKPVDEERFPTTKGEIDKLGLNAMTVKVQSSFKPI